MPLSLGSVPEPAAKSRGWSRAFAGWHLAKSLIATRTRIYLHLLIAAKGMIGLLDLLLASLMYLLFVILQSTGPLPPPRFWWVPHSVPAVAVASLIVVVARSLGEVALTREVVTLTQSIYGGFLLRLSQGYCDVRWEQYVVRNRSELLKYCSVTALDAAFSYQLLIEAASSALVVTLLALALVYKGFWIACTLAVFSAGMLLVHRFWLGNRMRQASASRERASRTLQIGLAELFSSAKEIRAYRNAAFFQRRLAQEAANLGRANVRLGVLPQISRTMAEQGVVIIFLVIVLAVQLWNGEIHRLLSILVFYFVLSRRLIPLVGQMILNLGQMDGALENLQIVRREFDHNESRRNPADATLPPHPGYALELDHVTFAYQESLAVIKDIDLQIEERELVILRGTSGTGKSTLLNMIAGVISPTAGSLRVDRSTLAYVPQEITLLDDTIRVNLLFGLARKSDAELMGALETASLAEFVVGLPRGLDTRVGDNGVLFSGGQRQRLGLARALVRCPKLLLLDEATSALDYENERRVLDRLRQVDPPAILMVTHRPAVSYASARIYSMEGGALIPWAITS